MNTEDENENPAPETEADKDKEIADKAKAETMAYVSEVHELCQLAGYPNLAMDFVKKSVPMAEVRKALIDKKAAQSDASDIAGQIPANTNPITKAEPKIDTAAIYAERNKKGS